MIEVATRFAAVPITLRELDQWVVWCYEQRGDKMTKVPYNPQDGSKASSTEVQTWNTFDLCCRALDEHPTAYNGIGFMFKKGGGIFGFDGDHLYDPATGTIAPEAKAWLDRFATYTELSPGGHGIHAIGFGILPGKGKKREPFEVYDQERYFTITGNHVAGYPTTLAQVNGALTDLWEHLAKGTNEAPVNPVLPHEGTSVLTDSEVLDLADSAKNSAKFHDLWSGGLAGHASASSADLALCTMLAFWCRKDADQMDRLFRQSGLMRDKWDERRGGAFYRELTIDKAIALTGEVYEKPEPSPVFIPAKKTRNEYGQDVETDTGVIEDGGGGETNEAPQSSKKPPKDIYLAAKRWAKVYGDQWFYDNRACVWRQWVGTHYEEVSRLSTALDAQAITVLLGSRIQVQSGGRLDSVIRFAKTLCGRDFEPPSNLVNFANGTLDVRTWEMHEHEPTDDLTYCLPYNFEDAPFPQIQNFLAETMPDATAWEAYMTHIGLALLGDMRLHYMVLLIGPKRSGKSTCLQLANAVCGQPPEANAGAELFNRDAEGLRSRASWNSRRIVTLEELPVEALRSEEIVKTMSAHGGVQMRHMYQRETLENRWRPKILMATNERPRYTDRTGALSERLVPILCPNSRKKEDRNSLLLEELCKELSGFATMCLELAHTALTKRRGVYPMSPEMETLLEEIERDGDPLKAFIRDDCATTEGTWTATATLYQNYRSYCFENGNQPLGKERFAMAICERYLTVTALPKKLGKSSTKTRGLSGITLTRDRTAQEVNGHVEI